MKLKRASIITIGIILAVFCYFTVTFLSLQNQIADYRAQEAELSQEVDQLRLSNDALRLTLEGKDDPSYQEDIARDKLGLVKPGERVFIDVTG